MHIRQRLYLYLCAGFVTSLVIADVIGSKFALVGGRTLSVGMIPFPITFLLTDLINEYYGREGARRVTLLGLAMAAFAFGLILLARVLPVSPKSPLSQEQFDAVFGMSNRLYVASLTAYLIGQLVDISTFHGLKRVTGGRHLWLRATGSTVISQAIDSLCVTSILLYGTTLSDGTVATAGDILEIAATGYVLKFFVAVGLTPLIYAGHRLLHAWFDLTPVPADEEAAGAGAAEEERRAAAG